VDNVFTVPAGQSIWKAITTPYLPSVGAPNAAGTVETRAFVANGAVTVTKKVNAKARLVKFSGQSDAGRRCRRRCQGRPSGQTASRPASRHGPTHPQLQPRAEEDGQEDDIDVPGTHDPWQNAISRLQGVLADARGPGWMRERNCSPFTSVSAKIRIRL